MVGVPNHVTSTPYLVDLDPLQVIRQVRDQFVRIPVNVKVEFAENHFPKELLLEFLQLNVEAMLSVLRVHDRA
jgi:hypothetical protein